MRSKKLDPSLFSKISRYAVNICKKICDYGYEAYFVGGSVRDLIMGSEIHDYDITTNADTRVLLALFQKDEFCARSLGGVFGTIGVKSGDFVIEITPYRDESDYRDHRHPGKIAFIKDVCEDLKRRDFTMNSLILSYDGTIYDYFGGICDIEKKLIRCIGHADDRFHEDALRILRALRFSSVLGFDIEESTSRGISNCYKLLSYISAERKYAETKKILLSGDPYNILYNYKYVFDEFLFETFPDKKLKDLPYDFIFRLFFLLKDACRKTISEVPLSIRLSSSEKNTLLSLYDIHSELLGKPKSAHASWNLIKKYKELCFDYLRMFSIMSKDFEIIEENKFYRLENLDISGNDITKLNISGEKVGEILDLISYNCTFGSLRNEKSELLNFAKTLI